VARVRAYAQERGVDIQVKRFSATTRTAEDAARQIGTEVKRIVKSLVFIAKSKPVVVLCSGDNRVSLVRLEEIFRTKDVRRATAEEVKAHTGYAIGGVPPFARVQRAGAHSQLPSGWVGAISPSRPSSDRAGRPVSRSTVSVTWAA